MNVFITLILKILPLYFIIFLGFIAGRFLKVHKESVASLLIYLIVPVIIFHGIYTTKISAGILLIPVIFFIIAVSSCLLFYKIGGMFYRGSEKNILSFTAGTGNTGYFGLPVAVLIFGEKALGIVALIIMGIVLYENSLGFFITARGHHTINESIRKLIKLPSVYAFLFGITVNLMGVNLGQIYSDTVFLFRGAYTVLGMMIIGMGLSLVKSLKIDFRFVSLSFLARYVFWPSVTLLLIYTDNALFHLYDSGIHRIMLILSFVPLAANTVSYAVLLKTEPEKASVAVMLSTLLSLFLIPLAVVLFV